MDFRRFLFLAAIATQKSLHVTFHDVGNASTGSVTGGVVCEIVASTSSATDGAVGEIVASTGSATGIAE